jgi:hypothetical protein
MLTRHKFNTETFGILNASEAISKACTPACYNANDNNSKNVGQCTPPTAVLFNELQQYITPN